MRKLLLLVMAFAALAAHSVLVKDMRTNLDGPSIETCIVSCAPGEKPEYVDSSDAKWLDVSVVTTIYNPTLAEKQLKVFSYVYIDGVAIGANSKPATICAAARGTLRQHVQIQDRDYDTDSGRVVTMMFDSDAQMCVDSIESFFRL